MTDTFIVRVPLRTPIALNHPTTLDAILAHRIYKALEQDNAPAVAIARAHEEIPLERTHNVWHGSSILLEANAPKTNIVIGSSLRAATLDPTLLKPKKNGGYLRADPASGDYRNRQSTLQTYGAKAVYWIGRGDVKRVSDLLTGIVAIGEKRTAGFGEVSTEGISVTPLPKLPPSAGVVHPDGKPARPVPIDVWPLFAGEESPQVAFVTHMAPYFDIKAASECAVPGSMIRTRAEIIQLMGN